MTALVLIAALSAPPSHVTAATNAARVHRVDANTLLAIAFHESRYKQGATRKARGGVACGVMQVRARSADHCERMRADVAFAYLEGARMLRAWLDASGGDEALGLAGYACGWHRDYPRCRAYAVKVMRMARRVEA